MIFTGQQRHDACVFKCMQNYVVLHCTMYQNKINTCNNKYKIKKCLEQYTNFLNCFNKEIDGANRKDDVILEYRYIIIRLSSL